MFADHVVFQKTTLAFQAPISVLAKWMCVTDKTDFLNFGPSFNPLILSSALPA